MCAFTPTADHYDAVVAASLAELDVLAGPALGPLTVDTAKDDNCHPNDLGKELLGGLLGAFFAPGG